MRVKVRRGVKVFRGRDLLGREVPQQDLHVPIAGIGRVCVPWSIGGGVTHGVILSLSPVPNAYPKVAV